MKSLPLSSPSSFVVLSLVLMSAVSGAARAAEPSAAPAEPVRALTRAEVVAQVIAARKSGELDVLTTEDSGSFYLSRQMARMQPAEANLASVQR